MRAQESAFEVKLEQRDLQVADIREKLAAQERRNRRLKEELRRCQSEGTGIREEVRGSKRLNLTSARSFLSDATAESAACIKRRKTAAH